MGVAERKFVDVFAPQRKAFAKEVIPRIATIYPSKQEAKGKSTKARVAILNLRARLSFGDLEA